ncbi:hypothetical protein [Sulfitobacter sp. R86518]|uniref:hypothetical protein n=1 Tax=Sulfitobacter sp. R86518 TaxID=3093858 RepID=UPI0036DF91C8
MAAELPNKRHEEFARLIAGGVKQRDAYARAGYASANNRAAASRLAKKVAARVEELRQEESIRIYASMGARSSSGSLADLGITISWCAEQYRKILSKARASGDWKSATDATRSLEKLIRDAETRGSDAPKTSGQKIDIDHMMSILSKFAAPSVQIVDDHPATDAEVSPMARNRALGKAAEHD